MKWTNDQKQAQEAIAAAIALESRPPRERARQPVPHEAPQAPVSAAALDLETLANRRDLALGDLARAFTADDPPNTLIARARAVTTAHRAYVDAARDYAATVATGERHRAGPDYLVTIGGERFTFPLVVRWVYHSPPSRDGRGGIVRRDASGSFCALNAHQIPASEEAVHQLAQWTGLLTPGDRGPFVWRAHTSGTLQLTDRVRLAYPRLPEALDALHGILQPL